MADLNIDQYKLPSDIREKLAELDLELSEGRKHVYFVWEISSLFPHCPHFFPPFTTALKPYMDLFCYTLTAFFRCWMFICDIFITVVPAFTMISKKGHLNPIWPKDNEPFWQVCDIALLLPSLSHYFLSSSCSYSSGYCVLLKTHSYAVNIFFFLWFDDMGPYHHECWSKSQWPSLTGH